MNIRKAVVAGVTLGVLALVSMGAYNYGFIKWSNPDYIALFNSSDTTGTLWGGDGSGSASIDDTDRDRDLWDWELLLSDTLSNTSTGHYIDSTGVMQYNDFMQGHLYIQPVMRDARLPDTLWLAIQVRGHILSSQDSVSTFTPLAGSRTGSGTAITSGIGGALVNGGTNSVYHPSIAALQGETIIPIENKALYGIRVPLSALVPGDGADWAPNYSVRFRTANTLSLVTATNVRRRFQIYYVGRP